MDGDEDFGIEKGKAINLEPKVEEVTSTILEWLSLTPNPNPSH